MKNKILKLVSTLLTVSMIIGGSGVNVFAGTISGDEIVVEEQIDADGVKSRAKSTNIENEAEFNIEESLVEYNPEDKCGLLPIELVEVPESEVEAEYDLVQISEEIDKLREEHFEETGEALSIEECFDMCVESETYENDWDRYSNNYVYNKLDDKKKLVWQAFDKMCLEALDTSKKKNYTASYTSDGKAIYFMGYVSSDAFSDVDELIEFLGMYRYSNPQYFFVSNQFSYYPSGTATVSPCVYNNMANYSDREAAMDLFIEGVNDFKSQIDRQVAGSSDQSVIFKAITDVIAKNVTYNHDSVSTKHVYEQTEYTQSAFSTFTKGTTVCAGYAMGTELLANDYGIDCMGVTAPGHAYNIVRVNDSWYYSDTTWNDTDDSSNPVYYQYFLKSSSNFCTQASHMDDPEWTDYRPVCNQDSGSSWYTYKPAKTPTSKTQDPVIYVTESGSNYEISIVSPTAGTEIYYTIDGTKPSSSFTRCNYYNGSLIIAKSKVKTIRAMAVKDGMYDSDVVYRDPAKPEGTIVNPTDIELDKAILTDGLLLNISEKAKVEATVLPEDATEKTLEWRSSDASVATVDANGNVEGIKPGTAVITVSTVVGGISKSFNVRVCQKVNVYFDTQDKDITLEPKSVEVGQRYGVLPVPEKDGYTFIGWYTEKEDGEKVDDDTIVVLQEDHTLYALWKANGYTVTFEYNDGSGNKYTKTVTFDEPYGEFEEPVSTNKNYRFRGFYTESVGGEKITADTICTTSGNHSLYAHWDILYTIKYDSCGGYAVPDDVIDPNNRITVLPEAIYPNNLYVFDGWYTARTEGTKFTDDNLKTLISDITLYAHWKEDLEDLKDPESDNDKDELKNELGIDGDVTSEDIPTSLWVTGVKDSVDYTGAAVKFDDTLHVYHHKTLLKQGTDYAVKYSNNINAGRGSVVISGKGNYTGSITKYFTIKPLSLTKKNDTGISLCTAPDVAFSANGKLQKGTTTITYNINGKDVVLKSGKDYTLEYPKTNKKLSDYDANAFTTEGSHKVIVKGKGNYADDTFFMEEITAEKTPVSKLKFTNIPNQTANSEGKAIEPSVIIKDKIDGVEKVLNLDPEVGPVDAVLEYQNNKSVGKASVIVRGTGDYTGSKVVNFNIVGIPLSKAAIDLGPSTYLDFTGQEVKLTGYSASYADNNVEIHNSGLTEGKDYTVSYLNNVKAGKSTIVFTGIGKFTGTVKKNFTINKHVLSADDFTLEADSFVYEKGGVKPKATVKCNLNGREVTLIEGTDYTVKYTNNAAVNKKTPFGYFVNEKKAPTVTVTGKGNYSGTLPLLFEITPSVINGNGVTITATDVVYQNKAGICKPTVTLYDTNGKKLSAGSDYDKNFEYVYASDDVSVKRIEKINNKKVENTYYKQSGDAVDLKNDIIPAGTRIKVTVAGKGNYIGNASNPAKISTTFRFATGDINKASVSIPEQIYTGKEVKIDGSQIKATFKVGSTVTPLVEGKDYRIDPNSYVNNIKKGTAKVTIVGIGNYGGSKVISYKISTRNMNYQISYDNNDEFMAESVPKASGTMKDSFIAVNGKLSANKYVRAGYTFVRWNTKADGTGVSFADKSVYTSPSTLIYGNKVKLYAQWKKN